MILYRRNNSMCVFLLFIKIDENNFTCYLKVILYFTLILKIRNREQ